MEKPSQNAMLLSYGIALKMVATPLTDLAGRQQMPKPVRMSKPDEQRTKRIVELIYRGLARGWSYQHIADKMNEIGVRSLRGCMWNYYSIQQVTTVINTGKASWYRWAYDLLHREGKLPVQIALAA